MMFCSTCGKELADAIRFCPECGTQLRGIKEEKDDAHTIGTRDQTNKENLVYPRNPSISPYLSLLSILLPGIPQVVYGQIVKGIVIFVVAIFLRISLLTSYFEDFIFAICCGVDAYMVGKMLKDGFPVGKWQFFPKP